MLAWRRLFRLLVTHKYGGVYLDMDSVCLRDLNPVLGFNEEFMYQWGSSGTNKNNISESKINQVEQ